MMDSKDNIHFEYDDLRNVFNSKACTLIEINKNSRDYRDSLRNEPPGCIPEKFIIIELLQNYLDNPSNWNI